MCSTTFLPPAGRGAHLAGGSAGTRRCGPHASRAGHVLATVDRPTVTTTSRLHHRATPVRGQGQQAGAIGTTAPVSTQVLSVNVTPAGAMIGPYLPPRPNLLLRNTTLPVSRAVQLTFTEKVPPLK